MSHQHCCETSLKRKTNFQLKEFESVYTALQVQVPIHDSGFSVPIHDSYKHYLWFIFQGTTYDFQCLPFGLCSAPWTFTKLLKPVISSSHFTAAIGIVIYLDDILILDQSPDRMASVFHSIVNVLKQLGFLIKQEKCSQVPTQRIEFLRMDSPGIQEPHQRSRVKSCPTGHQVLSSHSNTGATAHQSTDGQFYSSCLRQQEKSNQVINAGGVSGRAMGSLPSEQHMDNSTTPSCNSGYRCGLGLTSTNARNELWRSQFSHV